MGGNDLIRQTQQAAILSDLIRDGNKTEFIGATEGERRISEQRLEIRDDKLYLYTLLPQYGGDICKKELVMTKEIFQECYKRWIEPQEGKE